MKLLRFDYFVSNGEWVILKERMGYKNNLSIVAYPNKQACDREVNYLKKIGYIDCSNSEDSIVNV